MSEPPPAHRVVVLDEQAIGDVDVARWAALAADVLTAEGVSPELELTVAFVDPHVIAELKAEHLDGDGSPTDVLAFPIDAEPEVDGPGLLGDVVVCPVVAAEQAPANDGLRRSHDGSVDAELSLLIVHGILHLLGHDHHDDGEAAVMVEREEAHLARWLARSGAAS
ncbi:MAG: rRNA maturation RNase YbeY [Actinomycetota bacterium]